MAVEDSSPRQHWEPEYEHSGIEVDLDLVRDHLCARDGSERVGLVDPGAHDEETENWATQALGQDIGNLLAVVALLLSGYGYYTGSHRARLVWPGTLLYLLDAYVVYSMAVHFNELFLVHVAALGLSSYAVMFSMDGLRAENAAPPQPSARRIHLHRHRRRVRAALAERYESPRLHRVQLRAESCRERGRPSAALVDRSWVSAPSAASATV